MPVDGVGRIGSALVQPSTPTSLSHRSTTSADITLSDDADDLGFSSDDDEAGVFFGAHKPSEQKIVAALSRSIPPSPAQHDLSRAAAAPRRSSLLNRVRKRDSREFLRRKTLLLPGTPQQPAAEKVWEGGFYEKEAEPGAVEPEVELMSSSSPSLPSRNDEVPTDHDSLQTDSLTSLETSMEDSSSSFASEEDELEIDKENLMEPEVYQEEEDIEEYIPAPRESAPISVGFGGDLFAAQDTSLPLDMGGLSIFDIDDPELVLAEQGNDTEGGAAPTSHDNLIDVTYYLPEASDIPLPDQVNWLPDPFDSPFGAPRPTRALENLDTEAVADRPLIAFSSPVAQLSTPAKEVADISETSFVSDMNSPVGRAPVVIPVWTSPVKLASPAHDLQDSLFSEDFGLHEDVAEAAVTLPSLESPKDTIPLPSHTPSCQVTWSLASPTTTRAGSAVTPQVKRDFEALLRMSQRPADKQQPLDLPAPAEPPPSAQQLKVSQRAEARSETARDQLDAIYSGSRFAGMGPPSRTAQNATRNGPTRPIASSSSSSLTRPTSSSAARATARPASQSSSSSSRSRSSTRERTDTSAKLPPSVARPVASKASRPVSEQSGLKRTATAVKPPATRVKPLAASTSTQASHLPRPAPRRPMAPPAAVSKTVRIVDLPQKVAVSLPVPEPSMAISQKRPLSATQAVPLRSTIMTVGPSRPTMGLPTRPLREQGGHNLSASTTVSHLPTRSPRATGRSPARSALGKPTRGATTPTPLRVFPSGPRGLPTPQRPLGSPTRSHKALALSSTPSRSPLTNLRPLALQAKVHSPMQLSPMKGGAGVHPVSPTKQATDNVKTTEPAQATEAKSANADAPSQERETTTTSDASATKHNNGQTTPLSSSSAANGTCTPPKSSGTSANGKPSTPPPASPERRTSPRNSPRKRDATASPEKDARRSKRATRTPARLTEEPAAAPRTKQPPAPSIVPGMSEKELKAATQRNTVRNQVYICSIDRQIVRVEGPRPPSPTSKIRTTAEKEEEDRKAGRGARAKRRRKSGDDDDPSSDEEAPVGTEEVLRAPGDEDDYSTPARPPKRAKVDEEKDRFVRWNRELTVIRGGLGDTQPPKAPTPERSAIKPEARYPLDSMGNAKERPVERLKRTKVVVRAVFYEGEEPAPFDYNSPPKKKKKG